EPTELYAAHYEAYIPPASSRSNVIGYNLKGMTDAFRNGDYDLVISLVKNVPEEDQSNFMNLLLGQSYMQSKRYILAKPVWDKMILENDPYTIDHAKWFQALNHLALREVDSAKTILNELASDAKADHYKEAKALLEAM
ncbi:MAG: hypothetical protein AAGK97_15840, partial [Bacteroidota bacterium]